VRRTPAEEIVEFLSFSDTPCAGVQELQKLSPRKWEHVLRWLDDAGLAFYFLEKLENTDSDAVPTWVISRLQRNFAANQQRVGYLSHRFGFLNQKFNEAGVRYAVLKGFSLVPQFCPDANLRHQSDFDYLVDDRSLSAAHQVLLEAGYRQKPSRANHELVFVMSGMGEASRSPEQYSAQAPHAVDLHLDVWESDLCTLPAMPRQFSVERTRMYRAGGFVFPTLTDEEAFLVQVLHACQHLFTYWIRMSSLLEIGYFLNQRKTDTSLWNQIEQQVGENLVLREFVVVITELVAKLFRVPIPELVRAWAPRIRPAPRVWIERYARPWAFCELPAYEFRLFPRAKLARFLHQQYRDRCVQKEVERSPLRMFPHLSRMASTANDRPSPVRYKWWKRRRLIRRSLFHALASLRYVLEIPRWRWLNRARMRVVSMDA
jgi:Uncharacterised nucleotidyltransferase